MATFSFNQMWSHSLDEPEKHVEDKKIIGGIKEETLSEWKVSPQSSPHDNIAKSTKNINMTGRITISR